MAVNNVGNKNKSRAAEFIKRNKKCVIVIALLAALLFVSLVLSAAFGIKSCAGTDYVSSRKKSNFNAYANTTQAGAYYKQLGTVERVKPVAGVKDGGLACGYPVYGNTLNLDEAGKRAVLAENAKLTAGAGTYDSMDKDGKLFLKGEPVTENGVQRRLYKHTASVGLYRGDVSDDEPGVVKSMSFRHRTYSGYYEVTGLYAPAGEVIKVQMSEEDMKATGGITIHIGQALYNGKPNNIWAERDFNRMPVILNTMSMTAETSQLADGVYTCYVGSYLGGPIYIRDEAAEYTVTISGGVNYSHFILGVTTEEEFERNKNSSAPYFDLEVWDSGVLHSGPKTHAQAFSYKQLSDAAVMWEKIASVSTNMTDQGIVFMYDPFVAAGAAVAFVGWRSVNCPDSWMASSLNYEAFVTSGSWGNMHEYNHNFQSGWGVGYTGEVTNNALNLVSYSLFTKISSNRSVGNYGGAGLSGWNCYTSATWSLNNVNNGAIAETQGLNVYATLLHNFGQDAFVKTKGYGAAYFNNWAENTHQNMSYYAKLVSSYAGVQPSALAQNDYPAFVPVSCVYQTGRSYICDGEKRYIRTMQPYIIQTDKPFTVDLRPYTAEDGQYTQGSIIIGNGLSYKIKNINSGDINGTFKQTDIEDVYTYTPAAHAETSGKIYVTLEIVDEGNVLGGKKADDVELVLEFGISNEAVRFTLNRTVYTYAEGTLPESAEAAYESNYAGNIKKQEVDQYNITQNSNTDIWLVPDTEANRAKWQNAPDYAFYHPNEVMEISGKLYFANDGKYRIAFRGRWNAALYLSFDGGKNYELAAKLNKPKSDTSPGFSYESADYYFDFDTSRIAEEAEKFVYFKSVLITGMSGGKASFMGIGTVQWQTPMFTSIQGEDGVTRYFDADGKEVSEEEARNTRPVEPKKEEANKVAYATAYRNNYRFSKLFESEYFRTKYYGFSYQNDGVTFDGEKSSPDNRLFNYKGDWSWQPAQSTFGHVNVGKKNASLDFMFDGKRFMLTSATAYKNNFKVFIDDKSAELTKISAEDGAYADYISPELTDDKHKVVIVCKGETGIESIGFEKDFKLYPLGIYPPSADKITCLVFLWLCVPIAAGIVAALIAFIVLDRKKPSAAAIRQEEAVTPAPAQTKPTTVKAKPQAATRPTAVKTKPQTTAKPTTVKAKTQAATKSTAVKAGTKAGKPTAKPAAKPTSTAKASASQTNKKSPKK